MCEKCVPNSLIASIITSVNLAAGVVTTVQLQASSITSTTLQANDPPEPEPEAT